MHSPLTAHTTSGALGKCGRVGRGCAGSWPFLASRQRCARRDGDTLLKTTGPFRRYCSTFAAELEGILEACEHPDPHNVIVNATVVFTPAEIAACGFIRTPSPVFTGKSVLLFAQCRVSTGGDGDANSAERPELKDDFRLCRMVMKRSRDMGRTWGAMQFVSPQSTGVGAAVFDRATQQVVLQYQLMPNANPYQGNTLLQVTSADDGATWSAPRDITPALAPCNTDSNNMICGGAGSRIQSSSGRLVFAGHNGGHSVCVWYSDDGGKTYTTSKTPIVGNEISLTEVSPGTLYMNGRNGNHPSWAGNRSAWSSFDNGATWTNASATDLTDVNCEGAVVTANVNGEPVLLFSEPHGPGRISYRIHCSRDKGKTWSRYIQVRAPTTRPWRAAGRWLRATSRAWRSCDLLASPYS